MGVYLFFTDVSKTLGPENCCKIMAVYLLSSFGVLGSLSGLSSVWYLNVFRNILKSTILNSIPAIYAWSMYFNHLWISLLASPTHFWCCWMSRLSLVSIVPSAPCKYQLFLHVCTCLWVRGWVQCDPLHNDWWKYKWNHWGDSIALIGQNLAVGVRVVKQQLHASLGTTKFSNINLH